MVAQWSPLLVVGWWWSLLGGYIPMVNVPCTCSATCCYAAQMSGSVASLYTLSNWSAVLEDLLLYLKCWQWRYVNLHAHLQQKTISPLKRLLWKERKKKPVNMLQWDEPKFHTKHEFCQILAREFGTIRLAEMSVSLWRKYDLLQKRCFYERGSRSAGLNVLDIFAGSPRTNAIKI